MQPQINDSTKLVRSQIEVLLNNRRGCVMRSTGISLEFFTKQDGELYQYLIDQYNKAVGYKCYD